MPKMLPPNTALFWVSREHAATEAEVLKKDLYTGPSAKAVNISCAVATGYTLSPTDSETSSAQSICDSAASNVPVRDNFEASIEIFREHIDPSTGQAANTVYEQVYRLFKVGGVRGKVEGWLIERIGYPNDFEVKEGQEVNGYRVYADNPRTILGEGADPIKMGITFLPQGAMFTNQKITA